MQEIITKIKEFIDSNGMSGGLIVTDMDGITTPEVLDPNEKILRVIKIETRNWSAIKDLDETGQGELIKKIQTTPLSLQGNNTADTPKVMFPLFGFVTVEDGVLSTIIHPKIWQAISNGKII